MSETKHGLWAGTAALLILTLLLTGSYAISSNLTLTDETTGMGPNAGVVTFPADGAVIAHASAYQSQVQWMEEPAADWYHVYIISADGSVVLLNQWYEDWPTCSFGQCVAPDGIWVQANGDYVWWLGYWSHEMGTDYGHTYTRRTFTIDLPQAVPPQPVHPQDASMQPVADIMLQWQADAGSLWYELYLGTSDYSTSLVSDWHAAETICAQGVCSLPVYTTLPPNDYIWWVRSWGPTGTSAWSILSEFTVSQAAPTLTPTITLTPTPYMTNTPVPTPGGGIVD